MDLSTLGKRVAYARSLAGPLSASKLAELAGLARTHVSNIEADLRDGVEGKTVLALSRALGVSTDWLLTGEGAEPTADLVGAAIERARAAAPAPAPKVA